MTYVDNTYPYRTYPTLPYPVYHDYRPAEHVYHYHYYYGNENTPELNVVKVPEEPIEVGDWVYSTSKNAVIGEVTHMYKTSLTVKGLYNGNHGDGWSLNTAEAVKINRP